MSSLKYVAFQIYLRAKDVSNSELGKYIITSFDYLNKDTKRPQTKDFLFDQAITSGRTQFKLIGKVNDGGLQLMEWCDEACNFDGMCSDIETIKTHKNGKYMKRTYSLEELPDVIDNALEWYNSQKSGKNFWDEDLHILAI